MGFRNLEDLKRHFPIDAAGCDVVENYNVAPSQEVLSILRQNGRNALDRLHWGLVPFWAGDVSIGNRLINARAETVAQKPSFREAFKKRRCLIPADGFYEWTGPKGDRRPVFLTLPDESPFAFAGLWETWDNRGQADAVYRSCAIITTQASASVRPIHHRMPAILKPEAYDAWLDPENRDTGILSDILAEQIRTELIHRPVSSKVNAAGNNGPSNIRPLTQGSLF